jgi:hypothetical protein
MVKIVGYDTRPNILKRVTCGNCGAILEYYQKDVKEARYSCMGDSSGHDYVPCPNCPDTWAAKISETSY